MTEQQIAAMRQALEKAYLAGFMASGEGYNGEYPFGDKNQNPEEDDVWFKDRENDITALTAALEQPAQQEPVAYMYPDDYERMTSSETFCTVFSVECGSPTQGKTTVALYTHPAPEPVIDKSAAIRIATALGWEPKREPLTDEERSAILDREFKQWWSRHDAVCRAIEAKLQEKNT